MACNKNPARYREDPSFIYRCENLAAGLREQGAEVWLGHLLGFPWHRRFDWVVFHRPKASWRFRLLHTWLRSRGVGVLADFDDLVFAPALASHSPGVVNGLVGLVETTRNFSLHEAALASFSAVTVSTQPLADAVGVFHPEIDVFVLPNAVHWSWYSLPPASSCGLPERPVISYMPGTRSHDRDFALVADALTKVLDRHPEARLRVTGPLDFSVRARPGQVEHREKLPFSRFHEEFFSASINLAPLEDTPFTCCKSALKVIEGAFWNVPTICSPLPDAERLLDAGALPATGSEGFEAQLEQLLGEPEFYARVSSGLRQRVLQEADIYVQAEKWLDWVRARACGLAS